jgi:hypothetical protein
MNVNDQANVPPPIAPGSETIPSLNLSTSKPLSWWLRKFFACNPFYLVSAALLLYGLYRVSIDEPFVNHETARLLFSFGSVQIYEILLVVVAIFLARRCLWYDSMLLVGLENLLVFVPFILISQAALTGAWMAAAVCGVGLVFALLRFGSLRKYVPELNLPPRLLGIGSVLLALNVALPLTYRHYINFKVGTDLDAGPDYVMNECMWLLVLPAALALVNFLPKAQAKGDLLPQRRWLPMGLFPVWFMVTAVHLYGLDYVYGYRLRPELLAPAAWALAWAIFLRAPAKSAGFKYVLLCPAMLAPFLATAPGAEKTCLSLAAANMAIYGGVAWFRHTNRLAVHLAFASLLTLLGGLPETWIWSVVPGASAADCVAAGLVAYFIVWTAWLPNPKLAVLGSVAFGWAIAMIFWHHASGVHWAFQGGLVFLVLRSLRWNDGEHPGAGTTRMLTGLAWAAHSVVWVNSDEGRLWMPLIPGMAVLVIYCVLLPCRGIWRLFVVPSVAMLVILSGPCSLAIDCLRSTPAGLLAVVASLIFLALGTVAALTRDWWHKHEH